jgi:hypothetical protein
MGVVDLLGDATQMRIEDAARRLVHAEPEWSNRSGLGDLVHLGSVLPSGLIHARTIQCVRSLPAEAVPLSSHGRWSSAPSLTLIRRVVGGSAEVDWLVLRLARYWLACRRIRAVCLESPEAYDCVTARRLHEAAGAAFLPALGIRAAHLASLRPGVSTLAEDLQAIVGHDFEAEFQMDVALSAKHEHQRAEQIFEQIERRMPLPEASVVLADHPAVLEPISPYAEDLADPLRIWTLTQFEGTAGPDLHRAAQGEAPWDRTAASNAALAVFSQYSDQVRERLLQERRVAEATQGLELHDTADATFGWANLDRLAAADPSVLPAPKPTSVAILVSPLPKLHAWVFRRLCEKGVVRNVLLMAGLARPTGDVFIPEALLDLEGGFRLRHTRQVHRAAESLGVRFHSLPWVDTDPSPGLSHLLDVAGVFSREQIRGTIADGRAFRVVFYGVPPEGERALCGALAAARTGLRALFAYGG